MTVFIDNNFKYNEVQGLTSDFLEYLLHTAEVLVPVLLLGVRARVQPSSGDLIAVEAASQAAAAAAPGGRPPHGTRRGPVRFHDFLLGFKARVIPAPRLPGRRGRGAYPSEARVLMLDALHLYPLTRVGFVRRTLRLRSDS